MLPRATTGNGYSWWWASHIRTKQSKWLEQNLQEMEGKVEHVLNLIQKDGDSFARRAEMYYKHRPELIGFVEESVRAYRSLAERYDKLSTDLQKANTTIASICPEKVTFDYDDDEYNDGPSKTSKNVRQNTTKIPKTPKLPSKDLKSVLNNASKTIQSSKSIKANPSDDVQKSGLTIDEALEDIEKLQKEIQRMQTVKESMKSSYEDSLAHYWDTESKIMEHQQRICSLQDEFQVNRLEEDNAQILTAEAALKSCEETLDTLQDQEEKSSRDAALQQQRFDEAMQKLKSLKQKFNLDQADNESTSNVSNQDDQEELEAKINESFEGVSKNPLTATELTETIDKLVNKMVSFEISVSSQTSFNDMLKKQVDDLHTKIQNLENDQVVLMNLSCTNDGTLTRKDNLLESESQESSVGKKTDLSWQEMLLSGLEDNDKILIEEYATILRNYKDAKKRLTEEEKINQGSVSQMTRHVRQLKSAIVKRENEIQLLKQKLKLIQETFGKDKVENKEEDDIKVTSLEEKLRTDIDAILGENLDFWLRISTAFQHIHKFNTQVERLQEELKKVKDKGLAGKSSTSLFTTDIRSDIMPVYRHLKEIDNKVTSWLEQSTSLKDELRMIFSNLSKIQGKITQALGEGVEEEEIQFSCHHATKLQGEISKMKQQNNEVNEELEAGLNHATALKLEIEKTLQRLEKEFGFSKDKNQAPKKRSSRRSVIPLRSFLFGAKSKKQKPCLSLFSCISHHK